MNNRFEPLSNGDPELTPSPHGEDCLGNGRHPGIPCCCDNCDHYLTCFPDWRELDDKTLNSLLTEEEQAEVRRIVDEVWEDLRGAEAEMTWMERKADLADQIVAKCVANQTLEGFVCDEEDKAAVRRIVRGETTAEEEVAKVLEKYRNGEAAKP